MPLHTLGHVSPRHLPYKSWVYSSRALSADTGGCLPASVSPVGLHETHGFTGVCFYQPPQKDGGGEDRERNVSGLAG
jgi:hypothetical protein